MRSALLIALVMLGLLADESGLRYELRRSADKATVAGDHDAAVVTVTSTTGIGAITLHRPGKAWPKTLVLKVNLKGLEGLTIRQGNLRLRTSLGNDWIEGFRRLDNGRWEAVELDKALQPKITKTTAGVAIDLSAGWLDAEQEELVVEWIDFYR